MGKITKSTVNAHLMVKFSHRRVWLLFLGFLLALGVIWWLSPYVLNNYHRTQGGRFLTQSMEHLAESNLEFHYCGSGWAIDEAVSVQAAKALPYFQTALTYKPTDTQTNLLLARTFCLIGKPEKAIGFYQVYTARRPKNPLGHLELGFAYEAVCLAKDGNTVTDLGYASSWPSCSDSHLNDTIVTEWKTAGITPQNFFDKGKTVDHARQHQEALLWYSRASRMAPDWVMPWYQTGLLFEGQEDWEKAVSFYERALQADSNNRDIWYHLGMSHEALEQWDLSLQAYDKSIASSGQVGLSVIYYQIGRIRQYSLSPRDLKGALEAYDHALTLEAFSFQWQKGDTHYHRGILLSWHNRWDEAIAEYQNALSYRPDFYWAHVALSKALWETGNITSAKELALKAIDIDPSQKNAYHLLGELHTAEGASDEAQAIYLQILELDPKDVKARNIIESPARNSVEP